MTRINCIPIHLIPLSMRHAEYRESLRLRGVYPRKNSPKIPESYRMGKGHQTFFYDKGLFLQKRHKMLRDSLEGEGYNLNFDIDLSSWPDEAMNDWIPDVDAQLKSVARIIHNKMNPVKNRQGFEL